MSDKEKVMGTAATEGKHIKTITELQHVINRHFYSTNKPLTLYAASAVHHHIEAIEMVAPPVIGFTTNNDFDEPMNAKNLFLFWKDPSGISRDCSLLDRNIPENGYNDWYFFANHEDAKEYIMHVGWVEGGHYVVDRKFKEQHSYGLSGVLTCVHVHPLSQQAVMSNSRGLHIISRHIIRHFKLISKPEHKNEMNPVDQFISELEKVGIKTTIIKKL